MKVSNTLATELDKRSQVYGDMLRLMALTGMRFQELAALKRTSISLENLSITVQETRTEVEGKQIVASTAKTASGVRNVTLLEQAVPVVERLLASSKKNKSIYLASMPNGAPVQYRTFRRNLKVARTRSGVGYSAHAFRHLAASLFIAAGAPIETVRENLGHASTKTTESIYRHAITVDRRTLSRALSAAVSELFAESVGGSEESDDDEEV